MIVPGSQLWQYLSVGQRVLAEDGAFLVSDSVVHASEEPTDYSYLVFPFAKMYEGFLKQLFLDVGFISQSDYTSTHFRIGKALSPNLARRLGQRSVYGQTEEVFGKGLATRLWHIWKEGRNLVFHYFPHNYRALSRDSAVAIIDQIIETMEEAVRLMHVRPQTDRDRVTLSVGKSM
jgi:hypothetical protein